MASHCGIGGYADVKCKSRQRENADKWRIVTDKDVRIVHTSSPYEHTNRLLNAGHKIIEVERIGNRVKNVLQTMNRIQFDLSSKTKQKPTN